MKYRRDNNRKNIRGNRDNRSVIIMLNAAVILVVVIIAMVVQLVRLNRRGMSGSDTPKSQVVVTESAAKEAVTEEEKQEDGDKTGSAREFEKIRTNLDPDRPMVALTFDDGPYDAVTDRIVKVLAENDSRATFFVVGNRIEKYAKTLKNAYDHGNQIATHTFDHKNLSKMKKAGIQKELRRASKVTKKVTGEKPGMLRPPYGSVSKVMRNTIDMPMIYWNVDTEDWSSRNKKKILKKCKNIQDGDIVLMHDLYKTTADAVKELVPKLRKKGYQLVTVEELFYYKGIKAKGGKVYYNGK